jgi:F-type H+-transporting ATPase subunit epsilon
VAVEVHLVTPEREIWGGQADMVIARGVEGEVGILAGHAPLLIRLAIGPLRIRTGDHEDAAVVDGGFLHVTSGEDGTRVDVLASYAEMSDDIDRRAAEHRLQLARERVEQRDDAAARAELAKALARVHLAGG